MNNPEVKYIRLSKLDAAKRQLESALKLFFVYGDVVTTHTLAAASHKILLDLGKRQGVKSMVKDEFAEMVKEDMRPVYFRRIAEAENFFKHADKDDDGQLKFYFRGTEYLLWDACLMYEKLTHESVALHSLYSTWFAAEHAHLLKEGEPKLLIEAMREIAALLPSHNRTAYFQLLAQIEASQLKFPAKIQ